MRYWLALRNLLGMGLIFSVLLLAIYLLVESNSAGLLIPTPAKQSQGFFDALEAHRFTAAKEALSVKLRASLDERTLRAIGEKIEEKDGGISTFESEYLSRSSNQVELEATIVLQDETNRILKLSLVKEDSGLWKIDSFDPPLERAFDE